MEIANLITGSIVAMTFGALAYFCKRLIDDNDKQHKKTQNNLQLLRGSVKEFEEKVGVIEREIIRRKAESRFGNPTVGEELEKIKRKVSKTIIGIHQVQKDIDEKIIPQIEDNKSCFGEVTWIKSEVASQNEKLSSMYKALSTIIKSRKH